MLFFECVDAAVVMVCAVVPVVQTEVKITEVSFAKQICHSTVGHLCSLHFAGFLSVSTTWKKVRQLVVDDCEEIRS